MMLTLTNLMVVLLNIQLEQKFEKYLMTSNIADLLQVNKSQKKVPHLV